MWTKVIIFTFWFNIKSKQNNLDQVSRRSNHALTLEHFQLHLTSSFARRIKERRILQSKFPVRDSINNINGTSPHSPSLLWTLQADEVLYSPFLSFLMAIMFLLHCSFTLVNNKRTSERKKARKLDRKWILLMSFGMAAIFLFNCKLVQWNS